MEVTPYYGSGDGGGGAGGKQLRGRRRYAPARTPYDRPLESRHGNSSSRSWFSRIVNPIASGAGKLFSSVFRRPEETSSSSASSSGDDDDEEDNTSEEQEQEENILGAIVLKDDVVQSDSQGREITLVAKDKNESKLTEIENLVNSKTFTRDEFIHLTVLLQSRVIDSSGLKKHGHNNELSGNYLRNEALEEAQRWQEERRKSQEEGGNSGWDGALCGNVASLDLPTDVPDNAASSPVDIAKAYMGVRPTWASSSPVALLPYKSTESGYPRNNHSFVPTTKEFWSGSNSQHEDRYRTPTPSSSWNNTHRVTYSPYSRAGLTRTPYHWGAYSQHSIQRTDNVAENDMTSSRFTQNQHSGTGGYEILKRRSSMIDDDQACIGPVRRTRQKSFGNVSSFFTPYKESISKVCDVPTQSSLTAQKILENTNEKLPLSGNKPSEEQLASVKDKTTDQLTTSVTDVNSKKSNNITNAPSALVSSEGTRSVCVSSAISEKTNNSQPNIVEGLENKACETTEGVIIPAIQTSKSLPLASDAGLNCKQNPTFEFGSGNMSKGPIFSFATNGSTNSNAFMPKFDFKFQSKRDMLFSAAVEAAVASESSSQSALSSNPISTSQSASNLGAGSNSKPAFPSWTSASFKTMSSSPFSNTLFSNSSSTLFQSTGSPLFSTSVASVPASFTSFTKNSSQTGTGNISIFGSSSSTSFGVIPTTRFNSGIAQPGVSITPVSAATASSSSGVHSNFTLAFGSSSSSLDNSVPPLFPSVLKTSSTSSFSFGTSSQFGSGGSENGENKQASSLVETVEAATDKTTSETKSSIECGLDGRSLTSTGLPSSSGLPTQIIELTSSTSAVETAIGTTVVDGQQSGQMNGNDLKEPSKLTATPLSGSVEQTTLLETTLVDGQKVGQIKGNDLKELSKISGTPLAGSAEQTSSTVSRSSAALAIDSQSNAESSEAKAGIPSQKLSIFDTHTSEGHKEVADNGADKRSRRIVRVKRDRARKK
ncbi:nuclear pore complex protein NUP1 [Cryptomeria japonica]|uniref:nuclear pore complex protein NUP1 n=1 Tax=Cryptomeria japonica TaxID=3369 RepID=UPI0025ACB62A|nr:nuclear pore complex protein NUP1 [Cryptomeria japonica]